MKKVLIVSDAWTPQVNGVVTVLAKTKKILEDRGYQVSLIHPGMFRTLPIPFYPEISLALFPGRRISRIIATELPDHIHIATEGPLGFAARRVCSRKKIRFTTSYHTHFAMYLNLRFPFLLKIVYSYLRWFHKGAASTMVATKSLYDALVDFHFDHLVLWPLGVDTKLFRPHKDSSIPEFHKPVFLYFGRIAIEKNVEEFLQCKLKGTKIIVGDGPDREHLEKKYGSETTFVPYKKGEELVSWISIADVFVFPSRTETFGLVVVEALACGVPVAAHDVMGPRDIITPGKDGYLSENLEEAAVKCLTLDRKACREKALQYSWDNSADAFIKNLVLVS